jgi:hypothetical protein
MICMYLLLASTLSGTAPAMLETVDIAPVWSGHPVGFCLYTHKDIQLAAFYDADRNMTVAKRALGSKAWQLIRLPEQVKWDSHNSIVMTVDDQDHLHLSGNMHVKPLVYFRTKEPLDITTFERMSMVGDREDRVTYPKFIRGAGGELLFCYRDGSSGNGEELYNIYDPESRQWRRFLDTPLTSGEGERNAYIIGPVKGPDNRFHICWVWRLTYECETNHHLCYAASDDLRKWYSGTGIALTLPITFSAVNTIVDPVPMNGGIINGNTRLGFDSLKRPVVSYHKFDQKGNTQIYNARLEEGRWAIYQASDWDYRWEFSGGGTIIFEIGLSGVSPHGEGTLRQTYTHKKYGSGAWLLDEKDLRVLSPLKLPPAYPPELGKVKSTFEDMAIRRASDSGTSGESGVRYFLQWETLPQNRDKPRKGAPPPPSLLRVVKMKGAE